jgi:hypothetical protein
MTRSRLLALGAVLALAACASPSDPSGLDQLDAQYARWQAQHIESYRFDAEVNCTMCAAPPRGPITIEVQQGEVVRATIRSTGEPLSPQSLYYGITVESLFERLRAARAAGVTPAEVRFDRARGYPTVVEVYSIASDGSRVTTGALRPIS